jgi:hypothetical protein
VLGVEHIQEVASDRSFAFKELTNIWSKSRQVGLWVVPLLMLCGHLWTYLRCNSHVLHARWHVSFKGPSFNFVII